jgi:hypothetical protein
MPGRRHISLWDRAAQAVRKDAKKAGILAILLTVLAVMWVRKAMQGGGGPRHASAALTSVPGWQGAAGSGAAANNTMESAAALKSWLDSPLAPLGRNLFAINLEHFPQDNGQGTEAGSGNGGIGGELAKSDTSQADVRKQRQILLENLRQQASQLRLQSTLMDARPKAVIDGELVGEGDVVASFRVLKIEPRRVLIEREGIQLEVPMK